MELIILLIFDIFADVESFEPPAPTVPAAGIVNKWDGEDEEEVVKVYYSSNIMVFDYRRYYKLYFFRITGKMTMKTRKKMSNRRKPALNRKNQNRGSKRKSKNERCLFYLVVRRFVALLYRVNFYSGKKSNVDRKPSFKNWVKISTKRIWLRNKFKPKDYVVKSCRKSPISRLLRRC